MVPSVRPNALPARGGSAPREEPYPTGDALRSTQRQSPNLGLLSKRASRCRKYTKSNSLRRECKEKSHTEGGNFDASADKLRATALDPRACAAELTGTQCGTSLPPLDF